MDVVVGESESGSSAQTPVGPRAASLGTFLRRRVTGLAIAGCLVWLWLIPALALAGEVRLKNGLVLRGTPVKVETLYTGPKKPKPNTEIVAQPILMVSQPVRRYFLPRFQAEEVALDADLGREERNTLKHERRSGSNRE